jgi:(p)ppGpp synthase/HD superfamily hydrolase
MLDIALEKCAADFAHLAHAGQRYGEFPYVSHLADVSEILELFGYHDSALRAAAWLHDVLEDTRITRNEILGLFGSDVEALVYAVTDEPGANRKERKLKTYPKIRAYGADAVRLKLADRIANVAACLVNGDSRIKMYRREFAEFSTALHASGECDAMWDKLRGMM